MKKDRSHHAIHVTVSYTDDLLLALGYHIGKDKATPDDLRAKIYNLVRAWEEDLYVDYEANEETR